MRKYLIEPYLRFDAYLIKLVQEAYLYLFDRTGVYAATLAVVFYVPVIGLNFASHPFFNGFMFLAVTTSLGRGYYLQDKQAYAQYNAVVETMRNMSIRHPLQISILAGLLVFLVSMDVMLTLSNTSCAIYMYLLLIKIRERDKKPFFERKQELATEGAS